MISESVRLAAERETTGGSIIVQLVLDDTLKLTAALVEEQYMHICITNASCVCSHSTTIERSEVLLWTARSLPNDTLLLLQPLYPDY